MSSNFIAIRNSTSALKVKNQGSANIGTSEASFRLTTKVPPRLPWCSEKYAASGFIASIIFSIFLVTLPSRTAVLKGSCGNWTYISMRMIVLLALLDLSPEHRTNRPHLNCGCEGQNPGYLRFRGPKGTHEIPRTTFRLSVHPP